MILLRRCSCGPCLFQIRNIHYYTVLESNYYKVLGLSSTATQAEVKSAFYELSKKHHPDKNKGCEKSAKKFRDITAAYEVLKNEKLRRKYDNEQMSVRSNDYNQKVYDSYDYNEEVEKSYYERTSKNKSKIFYGKTRHYDFDAWYKAHYGPYFFYEQKFTPYTSRPNIKIRINYKYPNQHQHQHQYQYQYQYQYKYPKKKMSHEAGKPIKLVIYFLTGGSVVFLTYKCINTNR